MVTIKVLDTDESIIDTFDTPVDSQASYDQEPNGLWYFDFEIDTSKYSLLTDTKYMLEATYDNKTKEKRFFVYPTLEQSIIDAGNAQADRDEMAMMEQPIPDWVRNIFVFYANGEISDQDLLNALQYLIDIKVLTI